MFTDDNNTNNDEWLTEQIWGMGTIWWLSRRYVPSMVVVALPCIWSSYARTICMVMVTKRGRYWRSLKAKRTHTIRTRGRTYGGGGGRSGNGCTHTLCILIRIMPASGLPPPATQTLPDVPFDRYKTAQNFFLIKG
jgi:hypothetical protein